MIKGQLAGVGSLVPTGLSSFRLLVIALLTDSSTAPSLFLLFVFVETYLWLAWNSV